MIFLTVGTSLHPLDRLVGQADVLASTGEEVIVQRGTSELRPRQAASFDFLPATAIESLVQDARVVVCHAGVGSVAIALRHSKKPVVVARRSCLGEQRDDHQVAFAEKIAALQLATLVRNTEELAGAVARVAPENDIGTVGLSPALAQELVAFIEARTGHCRRETDSARCW